MIVVAIIGILAAVAIPGFMQYIKSSKTSEAKDNLNAIVKGATSYFQEEHCFDDTCMAPLTRLYPGKPTNVGKTSGAWAPASTTQSIPSTPNTVIGLKNSPAAQATALQSAPWTDLKYQINQPFYYNYYYQSQGSAASTADAVSTFGACAEASLSESFDSTFVVRGTADGNVGNIIDISKEGATASQVPSALAPAVSTTP